MNNSVQNLEEAANIASEFIYSLDNLPHEVGYILQEIKFKETRTQEIQQEIERDSFRYIRHSLKASNSVPSSPSSRAPSPKDSALPAKIEAAYADIHRLAAEKCALAQTLIDLVTRTRSRLDSDLARVRFLQGEAVDYTSALGTSYNALPGTTSADAYPGLARNPSVQISESLRSALTSTPTMPDIRSASSMSAPQVVSATPAFKKRRVAATASVKSGSSPTKHRSASPTTTAPLVTSQRAASRLSRQAVTRVETDVEEVDEDAEGDNDDADDERLYCFCQKHSYGDMIACDNEGNCPFEWFHLSCVGLKQPTPEKWYCSVCAQQMNKDKKTTTGAPKRGRKK